MASTSAPVADATVRIQGTELLATSDAAGAFSFFAVPVGSQLLIVEHAAYATVVYEFLMEVGAELRMPILLELVPESNVATSGRSGRNEILRDEIGAAARRGSDLIELIGRRFPSLRIRDDGALGGGTCIEYRGGTAGSCRQLGLVVDGVSMTRPSQAFAGIVLDDVERIELISPAEAGTRYGGVGGWGILTVQTRRGSGGLAAAPPDDRMIYGFDWTAESRPYPWVRVLISTTLVNAAAVSVSYFTNDCLRTSPKVRYVAIRTQCDSWGTIGSVVLMTALPSVTSSLVARWAGATPRSRGRFGPSAVIGSALTVGGYVALLYGDAEDSRGASVLGVTILTVGAPLFVTLSDRVLRVLR